MTATADGLWLASKVNDAGEKCLFRYCETRTSDGYFDEWDEWVSYGSASAEVHLYCFRVERETVKGAWINDGFRKRWIGNDWTKRYAYPTRAEAWKSFIAKKQRQHRILYAQLQCVESLLRLPVFTNEQLAAHDVGRVVAKTSYRTRCIQTPAPQGEEGEG